MADKKETTEEIKYAGFWIRFAAYIIDTILTAILCYCIQALTGIPMERVIQVSSQTGATMTTYSVHALVVIFLYFTISTGSKLQASPGKNIVGLKVITNDGSRITYVRSFVRTCSYALSYVTFLIGFVLAAFTKEKKALHDMVAQTRVVYIDTF